MVEAGESILTTDADKLRVRRTSVSAPVLEVARLRFRCKVESSILFPTATIDSTRCHPNHGSIHSLGESHPKSIGPVHLRGSLECTHTLDSKHRPLVGQTHRVAS